MDAWLSGGISLASLTEFYGQAGVGKTQFCLQLCVNVQKPRALAGLQGEALFIDGEGCFRSQRLTQIVNGALTSWNSELTAKEKEKKEPLIDEMCHPPFTEQSVLNHIHYLRIHSAEELTLAILYRLEPFLSCHPDVRLVVLDGLSYQLRYNTECTTEYKERSQLFLRIAHKLRYLAEVKNVAILITNQVTYDLDSGQIVPALGRTWAQTSATKIFLEKTRSGDRLATIVKSQYKSSAQFKFKITTSGISGI